MSAGNINYLMAQMDSYKPDPGTGKAIAVKQHLTIIPIITTTSVPSSTIVSVSASDTTFGTTIATIDRSEIAGITLIGSGGDGGAGTGGAGGGGGGGGEWVQWSSAAVSSGSLALSTLVCVAGSDTVLTIGDQIFTAKKGTAGVAGASGGGSGAGGTGGSAASTQAASSSQAGGAGGTKGTTGGGGGGEAGSLGTNGNAGSNGSTSTGGAGGTGTAGADGGAGGNNTVSGTAGTAPGGGGGGAGSAGAAVGAGAVGSCSFSYTPVGESNTLPDPLFAGATLVLWAKTLVCNRVITASTAFDSTGNTVISMDDVGDIIVLKSVPKSNGFRWQKIATNGPTLWVQ